jgi:hypothetical protein
MPYAPPRRPDDDVARALDTLDLAAADRRDRRRFDDPLTARVATFQRRNGLKPDGDAGMATRNMLRAALWERATGTAPATDGMQLRNAAGFVWPPNPDDDRLAKRTLALLGYLKPEPGQSPDDVSYGRYVGAIADFQGHHNQRQNAIIRPGSPTAATMERLVRPMLVADAGTTWNSPTQWAFGEVGRTVGGTFGIERETPPPREPTEREQFLQIFKIDPSWDSASHPEIVPLLNQLSEARRGGEPIDRQRWQALIAEKIGDDHRYQNVRNKLSAAQLDQDRYYDEYPSMMTDDELLAAFPAISSKADTFNSKLRKWHFRDLRRLVPPIGIEIANAVSYGHLKGRYEFEMRRRGLLPNDLEERRFP